MVESDASHGYDDDISFVNDVADVLHGGVVTCVTVEGKGRTLQATRTLKEGEVIFSEKPMYVVSEEAGNPVFDELADLCRTSDFGHNTLFFWCALRSLTSHQLGSSSCLWEPLDAQKQKRLLLLHQGDVDAPCEGVSTIAKRFVPDLPDQLVLERCLQAWVHNAFSVGSATVGHAVLFLASFMSHSCRPTASWQWTNDGQLVLRARRCIGTGEEVTIAYLDEVELLASAPERRRDLALTKRFWCACDRCIGKEDRSRGMRCPGCREGVVFARLPVEDGRALMNGVACQRAASPGDWSCVVQPYRPACYDDVSAKDLELWVTMAAPSLGKSCGKYYYEVKLGYGVREPQIGWATCGFGTANDWTGEGVGDCEHSWAADGLRHRIWHNGNSSAVQCPYLWAEGDVVGCAIDLEVGEMTFSTNGHWVLGMNFKFSPQGRCFYPALSLQGDFCFLFQDSGFESSPPDGCFKPLLGEVATRLRFDRWTPLRMMFAGTTCNNCGLVVNETQSQHLTKQEWAIEEKVNLWDPATVTHSEAIEVLHVVGQAFAQHILAFRMYELLAQFHKAEKRWDSQLSARNGCCMFTLAAYPGLNGAHAWALIDRADACTDVAINEAKVVYASSSQSGACCSHIDSATPSAPRCTASAAHPLQSQAMLAGIRENAARAAADYDAAVQILRTLFGSDSKWTEEAETSARQSSVFFTRALSSWKAGQ